MRDSFSLLLCIIAVFLVVVCILYSSVFANLSNSRFPFDRELGLSTLASMACSTGLLHYNCQEDVES